jgi:rRNA maturation endonuclease Nob1
MDINLTQEVHLSADDIKTIVTMYLLEKKGLKVDMDSFDFRCKRISEFEYTCTGCYVKVKNP